MRGKSYVGGNGQVNDGREVGAERKASTTKVTKYHEGNRFYEFPSWTFATFVVDDLTARNHSSYETF